MADLKSNKYQEHLDKMSKNRPVKYGGKVAPKTVKTDGKKS